MQQILAWSDFKKLRRGGSPTEPKKFSLKRDLVNEIVRKFERNKDFGKTLDALAHTIGYDNALDDVGTIVSKNNNNSIQMFLNFF